MEVEILSIPSRNTHRRRQSMWLPGGEEQGLCVCVHAHAHVSTHLYCNLGDPPSWLVNSSIGVGKCATSFAEIVIIIASHVYPTLLPRNSGQYACSLLIFTGMLGHQGSYMIEWGFEVQSLCLQSNSLTNILHCLSIGKTLEMHHCFHMSWLSISFAQIWHKFQ